MDEATPLDTPSETQAGYGDATNLFQVIDREKYAVRRKSRSLFLTIYLLRRLASIDRLFFILRDQCLLVND